MATRKTNLLTIAAAAVLGIGITASPLFAQSPVKVRVGYFPNITHAQALVGRATGRFEKALGPGAQIEWKLFNAGPSAIEALFAGAIDMAYIGSNPAVTGYVRSEGKALRIIAGGCSGGAALIVRNGSGIEKPEDFHGKKVASPQFGNTQDVSLREWLGHHDLTTTDKGGDVQVLPISNADQLLLFTTKQLDAAWAPEPWATRLIHQGNGHLFLDERNLWPNRQFAVTELIVRTEFLQQHPNLIKQWLAEHVELTNWINANLAAAEQTINQQIKKDTSRALPPSIVDEAFTRLQVTYDPLRTQLLAAANSAYELHFLGHDKPDLSNLLSLDLLNDVLREKKEKPVQ